MKIKVVTHYRTSIFYILEKKAFTLALYLRYANYVQTYIFGEKKKNKTKKRGREEILIWS